MPGSGGIGNAVIADAIEKQTGFETRCVVLGHLQRGGPPAPTTASWPPGWAWPPAAWSSSAASARWSPCGARSSKPSSARAVAATKTLDLTYYDEAAAFFH